MEQKITSSKNSVEMHGGIHHYGRNTSILITIFVLAAGTWFGATGKFKELGSVTAGAPVATTQAPSTTSTSSASALPPTPTESFVITDIKIPTAGTTSTKGEKPVEGAPANFKSFSYDATVGKRITVSGTCHDKYYAMLVFESKDDYRKDPGAAKSNRAFECKTSGLFSIETNMKEFNLPSGNYYLFIADQGSTGSWYNPR